MTLGKLIYWASFTQYSSVGKCSGFMVQEIKVTKVADHFYQFTILESRCL